ncbi:hypothetical protein ACMHYB_44865 [Sorangium sp. So ce1128]
MSGLTMAVLYTDMENRILKRNYLYQDGPWNTPRGRRRASRRSPIRPPLAPSQSRRAVLRAQRCLDDRGVRSP